LSEAILASSTLGDLTGGCDRVFSGNSGRGKEISGFGLMPGFPVVLVFNCGCLYITQTYLVVNLNSFSLAFRVVAFSLSSLAALTWEPPVILKALLIKLISKRSTSV